MQSQFSLRSTVRRLALMTLLLPLPALAARADSGDGTGYYVSALAGFGSLSDSDLGGAFDSAADFDAGFGAGLAAGYDFGRWRLELETLYQTNDIDLVESGLPAGWSGGDFSSLGLGLNGAWEFDLGGAPGVTSYLGAGLVWLQEIDIDFATPAGERSYSADAWGGQVFAGARYRLGERWVLNAEVRYLDAGSVNLDGEGPAAGRVNADYARTSVQFGLGYRF